MAPCATALVLGCAFLGASFFGVATHDGLNPQLFPPEPASASEQPSDEGEVSPETDNQDAGSAPEVVTPDEVAPDPVVAPPLVPSPIQEDDPAFDCRTMGNESCGVWIEDTWYIITFKDGEPSGAHVREFYPHGPTGVMP